MRDEELAEQLGNRLRELREARGASRELLAARAGIHPNWLGTVERGEQAVSVENFFLIARALDVDPGEILAGLARRRDRTSPAKPETRGRLHIELEWLLRDADRDVREFIERAVRAALDLARSKSTGRPPA